MSAQIRHLLNQSTARDSHGFLRLSVKRATMHEPQEQVPERYRSTRDTDPRDRANVRLHEQTAAAVVRMASPQKPIFTPQ